MRHWFFGIAVSVNILLAGPALAAVQAEIAPPAAESSDEQRLYDLCAHRDMAQGDAYRWSANEYERTTITWGEGDEAEVESDTYLTYGITANSLVHEVDEDQNVVAVTHRIERLYLLEDELLPPGTELVATLEDDETVYTVGGNRVENELLLYVLGKVANLHVEPGRDWPAMFRIPETPQPVGVRWEIDGPAFIRAIADERIGLDKLHASGEVHFIGPAEVYGVPGLSLELQFVMDGIDPVFEEAYPDRELRKNSYVIEATMMGAQTEAHLEQGLEMNARLTQVWHDPDADRTGTVVVYSELSAGQRELTAAEREKLGFESP